MTVAEEQTKYAESVAQPAISTWSFMNWLTLPAVDRAIAIIAIVPFSYLEYVRLRKGLLNIPSAAALPLPFC